MYYYTLIIIIFIIIIIIVAEVDHERVVRVALVARRPHRARRGRAPRLP